MTMGSSSIDKFVAASHAVNNHADSLVAAFTHFQLRVCKLLKTKRRSEVYDLIYAHASRDTQEFILSHYLSVERFVRACEKL